MDDREKFLCLAGLAFTALIVMPASALGGMLIIVGVFAGIVSMSSKHK